MKNILFVFLILGCADTSSVAKEPATENTSSPVVREVSAADTARIKTTLLQADSIILVSHTSLNEGITKRKTITEPETVLLVDSNKLNTSIIKEWKRMNEKNRQDIVAILFSPIADNSTAASCFEPRHSIVFYSNDSIDYIDICFECQRASFPEGWDTVIRFDNKKFDNLLQFYKRHGFTYMLGSKH